ncbi:RAS2 protein [Paramarasmius palmivorus]|uniref:RAS2 protein n=1 Tax=Paramarasmius palmivorus TaxID=297713 RepID=A0AAW0BMD5_9AGAR
MVAHDARSLPLAVLLSRAPSYIVIETYDPTIEDAFSRQLVVEDRMCAVEVIDTAGQEEFSTLRNQWIRGAEAFVVVYSVTSESSLRSIEKFWQAVQDVKKNSPPCIVVGNQIDRKLQREVTEAEGAALARRYGCEHVEASAKTSQNVLYPFAHLVSDVRKRRAAQEAEIEEEETATDCGRCFIM